MKRHADLTGLVDEQRISSAIQAAERRTSGTMHVSLAKHVRGNVRRTAESVFRHLGYAKPDSAAVLFFVVPSRRELVVLGGEGIHRKLGEAYWQRLVAATVKRVKEEDLTAALVHGVAEAGEQLANHFPAPSER